MLEGDHDFYVNNWLLHVLLLFLTESGKKSIYCYKYGDYRNGKWIKVSHVGRNGMTKYINKIKMKLMSIKELSLLELQALPSQAAYKMQTQILGASYQSVKSSFLVMIL